VQVDGLTAKTEKPGALAKTGCRHLEADFSDLKL